MIRIDGSSPPSSPARLTTSAIRRPPSDRRRFDSITRPTAPTSLPPATLCDNRNVSTTISHKSGHRLGDLTGAATGTAALVAR